MKIKGFLGMPIKLFLGTISVFLLSCKTSSSNKPIADFDYTSKGCDSDCVFSFQNKSQNANSFLWDFGDSTKTVDVNPTKKFNYPGTHKVTLTAKNNNGSASVSKMLSNKIALPVLAILPNVNAIKFSDSVRDKMDETKIKNVVHPIYLPNNCENGFAICNVGAPGSILNYVIGDVAGYYNVSNKSGSLKAEEVIFIHVTSKFSQSLGTSSLEIVSNASNGKSFFVSFARKSIVEEAKNILGTWRGTWSGKSYGAANPTEPLPDTAVGGTWALEVMSFDTTDSSATGTLTWNGNDAYWKYQIDGFGKITKATPVDFPTNFSIVLDKKNFKFILPAPGGPCHVYRLLINNQIKSSAYGKYGPLFSLDVDLVTNAGVTNGSAMYIAWPYAPTFINNLSSNQSNGTVSGKKD
jgi:PKD repeat protein